jgi:hypothetical protein
MNEWFYTFLFVVNDVMKRHQGRFKGWNEEFIDSGILGLTAAKPNRLDWLAAGF